MASPPSPLKDDGYVDMQLMAFRLPTYESDDSISSVSTPTELISDEVVVSLPSLYETNVSTSIVPSCPTSQARQAASLASVVQQEITITIPNSELMRFKFGIIVGVAYAAISLLLNLWIFIFVTKIFKTIM